MFRNCIIKCEDRECTWTLVYSGVNALDIVRSAVFRVAEFEVVLLMLVMYAFQDTYVTKFGRQMYDNLGKTALFCVAASVGERPQERLGVTQWRPARWLPFSCVAPNLRVLYFKKTHRIHYTSHYDEINCIGISKDFITTYNSLIFKNISHNF